MNDGITKDKLLFTAPHVLSEDAGMKPMVDTLAESLARIAANTRLPVIYSRIGELPEDLLDILAKDFKVDWYDYDADLETKRALIRDCFYVHRHLGTRSAVKRAIADVYGEGEVEEWFEYDGQPYHFVVHTSNTTVLMENRARFLRLLNIVKNVRSVLDNVTYDGEGKITIQTGAAICSVIGCASAVARRRSEVTDVE